MFLLNSNCLLKHMGTNKSPHRCLKICCGTTAIFLVIVLIVLTSLFLTVLKPKQPQITTHPTGLQNLEFNVSSNVTTLNLTLGLIITIDNPNFGSFEYKNTTAYVNYHGEVVAEVPMEHELVPARGKVNISTCGELMADKLVSNPYFMEDVVTGQLDLTSSARLHGKVSVLKILKFDATAYGECVISVHLISQNLEVKCKSRIKL